MSAPPCHCTFRRKRRAKRAGLAFRFPFSLAQVEFDTPADLLNDAKGHFRALVDASSDRDKLREMVQGREKGGDTSTSVSETQSRS